MLAPERQELEFRVCDKYVECEVPAFTGYVLVSVEFGE